jgi:hypothetical protein
MNIIIFTLLLLFSTTETISQQPNTMQESITSIKIMADTINNVCYTNKIAPKIKK